MKNSAERVLTSHAMLSSIRFKRALSRLAKGEAVTVGKKMVSALRAKLERLMAERQKMDRTIEAIQALLALEEANVPTNKIRLRPHILRLVETHPGKLTASDIASEVELAGYKPKGKTSTQTLVSIELARLAREEKIGRTKDGKYELRTMFNF